VELHLHFPQLNENNIQLSTVQTHHPNNSDYTLCVPVSLCAHSIHASLTDCPNYEGTSTYLCSLIPLCCMMKYLKRCTFLF